jgi:hypothetical protein
MVQIATIEDLQRVKDEIIDEIKSLINPENGDSSVKYLKSSQVCNLLKISSGKLKDMRKKGQIPFARIGGMFFYRVDDINRMMEKNLVK